MKDLKAVVDRIEELPTLPQVAARIMRLIDDPATSAQDIHKVMSRDQALAGKMLKLVNSAFYSLPHKVSNLNQAIVLLGFNTIKSLALSVSVFGVFGKARGGGKFDRELFWRHAVGSACIYRVLARKAKALDPETAFVAGLLHDIGKLVLDQYAAEELSRIIDEAARRKCAFVDAERALFGTDHGAIGAWLVERWGFPDVLAHWVRDHHAPGLEGKDPRFAISAFSDYLCKVKGIAASGSYDEAVLNKDAWACLTLEKADLPPIIQEVNQEIRLADDMLAVGLSS